MNPIKVTLNSTQLALAKVIGDRRMAGAVARGYKNKAGLVSEGWGEHYLGAEGELAFSVGTGVPWPMTVDTFSEPDFPPDVDIKTRGWSLTRRGVDLCQLLVRPESNPEYRYVHVVGTEGDYLIRGWAWGSEVMRREYLCNPKSKKDPKAPPRPPMFAMPNHLLRPLDELVRDGRIL